LLAVPAGRARRPRRAGRPWCAKLAEDLAEPVTHGLERRGPLVERQVVKGGETGDGLVHPGVTGAFLSRLRTFRIHVLIFLRLRETSALPEMRYPPQERYRPLRNEAHMNSAEQCREALQKLAGRLNELSPADRDAYFGNRTISVTIPDLGVTFATKLDSGDAPVREVGPGEPPADIRLTANSDEVVSLAESPMNIARAWVAGRVKIEASMSDLFRLRKLL
jgi:SCP-2 sterol transfer family